jgi:hypothetical protein
MAGVDQIDGRRQTGQTRTHDGDTHSSTPERPDSMEPTRAARDDGFSNPSIE